MSRENVEIVRRMNEAFARGQFDLAAQSWDPQGEWIPAMAGAIEANVYRGPAGLRRYFDELSDSFSEVRVNDIDFRDLGDRVLVLYSLSVRGRDSGLAVDQASGAIYELRGGKVVRGRSYLSRKEALEAVGLRG